MKDTLLYHDSEGTSETLSIDHSTTHSLWDVITNLFIKAKINPLELGQELNL